MVNEKPDLAKPAQRASTATENWLPSTGLRNRALNLTGRSSERLVGGLFRQLHAAREQLCLRLLAWDGCQHGNAAGPSAVSRVAQVAGILAGDLIDATHCLAQGALLMARETTRGVMREASQGPVTIKSHGRADPTARGAAL